MHQIQRIRTSRLVGAAAAATMAAAMMAGAQTATAAAARPAAAAVAQIAATASVNHVIGTRGDTFSPKVLPRVVHIGDRITFKGLAGHNATSTAGSVAKFASRPGVATFVYTVRKAGKYTYQCTFHRGMTGSFRAV
jgi:plastocyanin